MLYFEFVGAFLLTVSISVFVIRWRINKIVKQADRQLEVIDTLEVAIRHVDTAIDEIHLVIDTAEQNEELLRLYVDSILQDEHGPRQRRKVDWSKFGF